MPTIYHGTPMTPRAALEDVGAGRAFCVSFFHPQDVEVVQAISPAVMFRQRRVFRMESGSQARGRLVYTRGLDALLPMAGTAFVSSGALGRNSRCTRSAQPAQRFTHSRVAVWSEGRAAVAHGWPDRTAAAPVRAFRPRVSGVDRRRQDVGHSAVSRAHGRSRSGFGQSMAGFAHDARNGGCSHVSLQQRGQHITGSKRVAL